MVISAYQVNNVLRVYRDQLRHSKISNRAVNEGGRSPDRISISTGGKQKALIDKITSNIAEKIAQIGTDGKIGKKAFKELEDGYGMRLDVSQEGPSDMIFKVIDDGEETIKSFSLEDPEFMAYKMGTPAFESQDDGYETESEV